jgi:OOP family OmpA-OmpF porin
MLSQQRAEAVRAALIARGIPAPGLRAKGWGSARPLPDIEPADAANRRIDFEVVTIKAVEPTPIDTPGAG